MRVRIGAGVILVLVTQALIAVAVGPVHAADSPNTTTSVARLGVDQVKVGLAPKGGLQVARRIEPGAALDALLAFLLGPNFRLFLPIQPVGPIPGIATNVGAGGAVDADIHTKTTREECERQGGKVLPDGRCDGGYWDEFALDLES
jgi:hypothetical protein